MTDDRRYGRLPRPECGHPAEVLQPLPSPYDSSPVDPNEWVCGQCGTWQIRVSELEPDEVPSHKRLHKRVRARLRLRR